VEIENECARWRKKYLDIDEQLTSNPPYFQHLQAHPGSYILETKFEKEIKNDNNEKLLKEIELVTNTNSTLSKELSGLRK